MYHWVRGCGALFRRGKRAGANFVFPFFPPLNWIQVGREAGGRVFGARGCLNRNNKRNIKQVKTKTIFSDGALGHFINAQEALLTRPRNTRLRGDDPSRKGTVRPTRHGSVFLSTPILHSFGPVERKEKRQPRRQIGRLREPRPGGRCWAFRRSDGAALFNQSAAPASPSHTEFLTVDSYR